VLGRIQKIPSHIKNDEDLRALDTARFSSNYKREILSILCERPSMRKERILHFGDDPLIREELIHAMKSKEIFWDRLKLMFPSVLSRTQRNLFTSDDHGVSNYNPHLHDKREILIPNFFPLDSHVLLLMNFGTSIVPNVHQGSGILVWLPNSHKSIISQPVG
jgi:hypothetical protein